MICWCFEFSIKLIMENTEFKLDNFKYLEQYKPHPSLQITDEIYLKEKEKFLLTLNSPKALSENTSKTLPSVFTSPKNQSNTSFKNFNPQDLLRSTLKAPKKETLIEKPKNSKRFKSCLVDTKHVPKFARSLSITYEETPKLPQIKKSTQLDLKPRRTRKSPGIENYNKIEKAFEDSKNLPQVSSQITKEKKFLDKYSKRLEWTIDTLKEFEEFESSTLKHLYDYHSQRHFENELEKSKLAEKFKKGEIDPNKYIMKYKSVRKKKSIT